MVFLTLYQIFLPEDLCGTLTFAIWDNNLNEFIEQNDMLGKFQEQYPNIEIEMESGNGQNWNTMASQDTPFAEGSDIYKAYEKVYGLFTSGVLGKDPLGPGNDQVTSLFAAKKASIIALGDWGIPSWALLHIPRIRKRQLPL